MAYFETSDGLRLYFEDNGLGPPLICLPGLTRNCRDFDPLRAHLAGARIIAMDYRGRGQSDWDSDYTHYNVLREGHDVLELLDHLNLDQVTVLGTSRGGLIAMALAASHPERLAGVVLNDVGPVVQPAGIARIMEYLGQVPQQRDLDSLAQAISQNSAQSFPGVPISVWRRQAEAQFKEIDGHLALRYDAQLRRAVLETAASESMPDLWLFFEALKPLPLGLIHGANSDVLGMDTVDEMRRRHPGMIVAHLPDRGHVPFLDEPQSLSVIQQILDLCQ